MVPIPLEGMTFAARVETPGTSDRGNGQATDRQSFVDELQRRNQPPPPAPESPPQSPPSAEKQPVKRDSASEHSVAEPEERPTESATLADNSSTRQQQDQSQHERQPAESDEASEVTGDVQTPIVDIQPVLDSDSGAVADNDRENVENRFGEEIEEASAEKRASEVAPVMAPRGVPDDEPAKQDELNPETRTIAGQTKELLSSPNAQLETIAEQPGGDSDAGVTTREVAPSTPNPTGVDGHGGAVVELAEGAGTTAQQGSGGGQSGAATAPREASVETRISREPGHTQGSENPSSAAIETVAAQETTSSRTDAAESGKPELPSAMPPAADGNPQAVARESTAERIAEHLVPRSTDQSAPRLSDVEHNRLLQRVSRAFEFAQNRDTPVRLRLHPPELGALKLEIKFEGGVMSARLEAETAMARSILTDNLATLRERLAEQGIRIEQFEIDLADRHAGQGKLDSDDLADGEATAEEETEPLEPAARKRPSAVAESVGGAQRLNVIV